MSSQPAFERFPLISVRPEGEESSLLTIDVTGSPLAKQHNAPGQYAQVKSPEGPVGYFALANAPGKPEGVFEFLLKRGGAAADALLALTPPAEVAVSAPMGKGFPLEKARGRDLVLLTMGSGISALRPVLQKVVEEREAYGEVSLFHGDRTPQRMPFFSEHATWGAADIRVFAVFSRKEATYQGYVQDFLGEVPWGNAVVFLCGSKEMSALCRLELAKKQVGPDRIFTNF